MFRFNLMILSNSNNSLPKKKDLMKRNDFHILRRKIKNDT